MKLVIAGPCIFGFKDTYYNYLRQLARNNTSIIFIDLVKGDEKEELLSNAYLVVYPSLIGGLPLVILEAMTYKRCVLVSSVCDYYHVIKKYSVLFRTKDRIDLIEKLKLLIQNPAICKDYGRLAHDYVIAKFSWSEAASRFENILSCKV